MSDHPEAARASTPLRVPPASPPFHVVLVEPEIPPNTGNVARLCAATSSPLHLVGTLGFRIDDHAVRRAGLDYWPLVDVRRHLDWAHFLNAYRREQPEGNVWLFTARARHNWFAVRCQRGDALVFGRESVGLPEPMLDEYAAQTVALPTSGGVRSHNLANAVAIAVYEGLRQSGCLVGE